MTSRARPGPVSRVIGRPLVGARASSASPRMPGASGTRKCRSGYSLLQAAGGGHQQRPVALDLAPPGPRQQAQQARGGRHPVRCADPGSGASNWSTSGLPDVADRDAVFPVDRVSNGNRDGHRVHAALDSVDALLAPGPDLRADIEQHRDAEAPGMGAETQVELHVIDQHQQVRAGRSRDGLHAVQNSPRSRGYCVITPRGPSPRVRRRRSASRHRRPAWPRPPCR
jgi:hypothetical protein